MGSWPYSTAFNHAVAIHITNTTTITVLRPIYRSTCISRHLQLKTGGSAGAKFYCPHALDDGTQHIWIREKKLEFSTVSTTLSLYLIHITNTVRHTVLVAYITLNKTACHTVLVICIRYRDITHITLLVAQ